MSTPDELDDDLLDARLRDVAAPVGLHGRLGEIALDDEELHRRLRNVTIPSGMKFRLRLIAAGPVFTNRRVLAAAAVVLLAVGASFTGLIDGFIEMIVEPRPDFQLAGNEEWPSSDRVNEPAFLPSPSPVFAVQRMIAGPEHDIPFMLADYRRTIDLGSARVTIPRTAPTDRLLLAAADGRATIIQADVRGAPSPHEDLPDFRSAALHVPRGVEAALNASQRDYLLKNGVFPVVTPQAFMSSSVPPSFDTASFETARQFLASGALPPAAQMRTEEFLAAAEYSLARPTDRAARLNLAGGVAPWNKGLAADVPAPSSATRLLQVSVQARDLPAIKRRPTYLTVAVDVTSSMAAGNRLTLVRQALKSLVERLGTTDRFTLIALGAESSVLIEEGSRAELEQLILAIGYLQPQGAGRLTDGVFDACRTAGRRALPKNVERRIVVVSDAFAEFDEPGLAKLNRFLNTEAGRGLQLNLVDVGSDSLETPWAELARRREGIVVRAGTADALRAAFRQSLTGQNPLVARRATLTVSFHPEVVVGYRLLGHEPTALTAGQPQSVEFDLTANQTGTVLYELQILGGAVNDIATVVLKWHDPADDAEQEESRNVTRGMLGAPFDKAPPSLQMATLAAATAGRLRIAPTTDNVPICNVSTSDLLQWARRLERTRTVRGLEPWLTLLNDLDRLPSRKPLRGTK